MNMPAPTGSIEVQQGDALRLLRLLPDASIDCILTDPPYCAGGMTERTRSQAKFQGLRQQTMQAGRHLWFEGDAMTTGGLCWLLREVGVEAVRVLKPTGHLLVFADWRMVPMLAPAIESAGLRYMSHIFWDKGSMGLGGGGFRPQHESVMHFAGSSPAFHANNVSNVIRCPRVPSGQRENPTQKPLKLLRDLIRMTTPLGGIVCDVFAGSGATGVAAQAEGRRAVLGERDAGQVASLVERYPRSSRAQASLFEETAA
jgi:DNA modification methylase